MPTQYVTDLCFFLKILILKGKIFLERQRVLQGNLLFQLLLVGSDVLKLWGEGGVLVGLALARPTKALAASKPDRSL